MRILFHYLLFYFVPCFNFYIFALNLLNAESKNMKYLLNALSKNIQFLLNAKSKKKNIDN